MGLQEGKPFLHVFGRGKSAHITQVSIVTLGILV
jgi:hypothetical protein